MQVMVELYNGSVRFFTSDMEVVGHSPMVLFRADSREGWVKVGKVKRIYTSED